MDDPWAAPSPWGQGTGEKAEPSTENADPWAPPALGRVPEPEVAASGWGDEGGWGGGIQEAVSLPSWNASAGEDKESESVVDSQDPSYRAPVFDTSTEPVWKAESPEDTHVPLPASQLPSLPDSPPTSYPTSPNPDQPSPSHTPGFGEDDDQGGFGGHDMDLPPICQPPQLPTSPSLDDDGFGGFSSAGAGWGGEHEDDSEPPMPSWNPTTVEENESENEGEGWGTVAAKRQSVVSAVKPEDQEWELAQERLRRQQERAPLEVVSTLVESWTQLAKEQTPEPMPVDLKLDEDRDKAIELMRERASDTIRSLAAIPSDINTYPTVLSSTLTHQRFNESLARSGAKSSSSFLARPIRRHPRAGQSLSSTWDNEWTVRSKLGEPEAQAEALAVAPENEASRPGWGFWGRKSSSNTPQVLTTSGGGLLEVKNLTPEIAPAMGSPVTGMTLQAATTSKPASIRSLASSRPASPGSTHTATESQLPAASSSASSPLPPSAQAGPSAVSRFFNRLSRKPSSRTHSMDPDAVKDLELSQDDFSFLSEVPSISASSTPERGVGDLLMMEGGRTEEIASLESMLSSKPTPLPAPLAPPPRGQQTPRSSSSSPAFQSRSQKAAMSDLDLLSDMEFTSPTSATSGSLVSPQPTASSTIHPLGAQSSAVSDWDAFLSASSSTPPIAPSTMPKPFTPPSALTPPPAPIMQPTSRIATPLAPPMTFAVSEPSQASIATLARPVTPPSNVPVIASILDQGGDDDFGDFGSFSSPKPSAGAAASSAFDDFGDFEEFSSPPPPTPPSKSPLKPGSSGSVSNIPLAATFASPSPVSHPGKNTNLTPVTSMHAPTLNLINNTSGRTGRWPAPRSPVVPALDPPPQRVASQPSPSVFKLPPPPGSSSRVPTPLSQGFDAFDNNFGLGVGPQPDMGMDLLQPTAVKLGQQPQQQPRPAPSPFDLI